MLLWRPQNADGRFAARATLARARTFAQQLQPAAHTRLVVAVGVAETPLEIGLLARDHAVAHRDGEKQQKDQDPRAAHDYADATVNEKHAEIDGIAAPTVNSGRSQRSGGPGPLNWGRGAGEVANASGKDANTDE